MRAGDRQLAIVVFEQSAPQEPRIHLEIFSSKTTLDRYFPQARRAEEQFVVWVVDRCTRRRRQMLRLPRRPQQEVCVEQ
jgi:hypothetical protein